MPTLPQIGVVLLASYPRSGNHWVRWLVEESTNLTTLSQYNDTQYWHSSRGTTYGGGGAVIVPLDSDGPLRHAYAPTGGYSGTRSLPRGAVEPGGFDGGGGDADAASVAPAVRRPPPRLVKTHWPKEYGGAPLAPPGGSDAIRRATNAIVLHR